MLIVTYDFENDRRRTKFSKFLEKFGRRLQYSVFELKNSQRILNNICTEVQMKFAPHFTKDDSIVILPICEGCKKKMKRYGFTANEEEEVLFL
jgi:CRISPR-associated protein Cas2